VSAARYGVESVAIYNRSRGTTGKLWTIVERKADGNGYEVLGPSGRSLRFRTMAGAANRCMKMNREAKR
jgi:hypothetical protein